VFLNNRYYDPTIGVFTSVDPLVGKTGTPYLYANGNPTTLSDPSGLCGVGGGGTNDAGFNAALSACFMDQSVAQDSGLSAHDRFIYTLWSQWNSSLAFEQRVDDFQRRFSDSGGNDAYYNNSVDQHQRMVNDQAARAFVDRSARSIAGLSTGNGVLLFPEDKRWFPEPGRPGRVQHFPTEIVGTSGWKRSLVDDTSPARHLMGWVALSFVYGHGQATAGLRVAEGDPTDVNNSQQDYDLGVIGVDIGSGSMTVPEMITALDEATGDPGQGEFSPQRVSPSFPGMGQRDYTCYAFDWC